MQREKYAFSLFSSAFSIRSRKCSWLARLCMRWVASLMEVILLLPHPHSITDRLELRKRLQCKSFRWYLQNIYPELK